MRLRARIDSGWKIYARNIKGGDGPIPTSISIQEHDAFELKEIRERRPIREKDPNFQRKLEFYQGRAVFEQILEWKKGEPGTIKGSIEYMACNDEKCLTPKTREFKVDLSKAEDGEPLLKGDRGLLLIFFLSLGGGFAALLTPCVFPMIPLTVSFFTKQSRTRNEGIRNAIIYSISIILIFTAVGYLLTALFSSNILNVISTHPITNVFFFLIIVVFAISFLGGFEIKLPDSWINRSDQVADKGGLIGIFFMAVTLTLVSFSCTAPILGPLLVQATSQGGMSPLVGMGGFSLALALPFGLFAAFPGWLNNLPQSGGWMNTIKVTLGFLELALAFKFLSNADMVTNRPDLLIPRELFLAIWIGIFLVMALYLLGVFRTPNDGEVPRLSVFRVLFATFTIIFTIYLIPGLFGAPLNLVSGFPPPQRYSEWSMGGGTSSSRGHDSDTNDEQGGPSHEGPQGLMTFHDYEKALSYAKKVDKPLMLDFTGEACVNCRRMENNVWSDPEVLEMLRNDVVIASLYVDVFQDLPKEEYDTVKVEGETKVLKEVGKKWAHFQKTRFGVNSQPYYVLLNHQGEELVMPTGYEPDVQTFTSWLEKGIRNFKREKAS